MKKPTLAIVRGKFLNAYEMQIFEPLAEKYNITAFGSLTSYHNTFTFPVMELPSPMDIPDFPLKMSLINRVFKDAHYLYGLEEKLKGFDIVHAAETYYHYTQQVLNAKRKGYIKKAVATVLENIPFNNEGIWGRKEFKSRFYKEIDYVIALTQRSKAALLLEGMDEKKITVVSHGINTKIFTPASDWLQKARIDKKSFTILFSGRLEVYKGVFEILYAAKLLMQDKELQKKQLQFVFVGEGTQKQKMLRIEKQLGIEGNILHKSVSYREMPKEYQQADIFVAPSKAGTYWQEQYCTALLEAQAAGLPIVTTLSGGIPENIANAGMLVGPGDFYGLYEAIKTYLLYPKLRLEYAKKARIRAEKVHDVQIIAKKLASVYASLG